MARKFSELRAKMAPERRARSADRAAELILGIKLRKLREACGKTQTELAQALGTSQANVSQIESRADIQIVTLRRYVDACGGGLHIVARLPDQEVDLLDMRSQTLPEPAPAQP